MKTNRLILLGTVVSFFAIVSCQRNYKEELLAPETTVNPALNPTVNQQFVQRRANPTTASNSEAYTIELIGPNQVNENWEWVWSIKNNNPGNGQNGTVQDLSHWGMSLGSCLDWTSVLSAAYSNDGTNWISFTPAFQVDPSSCLNVPVLKFDFGTQGSKTSYFRLILNSWYPVGGAVGYYKSGRKSGCIPFYFNGIGCSEDTE
ncbi:MAG TPA: hypothetical protein VFD56_04325 [Chitinophagaceae bacterium]|nr:hypothetical protein [Chitinophagaceae bacterium]